MCPLNHNPRAWFSIKTWSENFSEISKGVKNMTMTSAREVAKSGSYYLNQFKLLKFNDYLT